ncbi:MAG: sensor histidine kinase [Terriglobia bacterium]
MNWTEFTKSKNVLTARKWARQFSVIFVLWTVNGLIVATQEYILARRSPHPPTWRQGLIPALLTRWIFALLTPGVLWLSARIPFERGRRLRGIGLHVLGALGFLIVWVSIRLPLYPFTDPTTGVKLGPSWRLYQEMILEDAYYACWMYGTIVAVSQLWGYYRKYREREVRASRLEAELAQTELKVLKMQMDPNFLLAALRSVSTLIHQDVEAADDLVASLSELLRISLDEADEQEVILKREIDYLNAYLEVQQIRFRNRLAFRVTVDPKSLDALVPNMILPALVENSLCRGMEEINRVGRVEIRSQVQDGKLRIEIDDDLPPRREGGKGLLDYDLGLANAKARLQHLYGASHYFALGLEAGGGSRLTLEIPLIMKMRWPGDQPAVEPLFEES